jgi:hypothetical protein
MSFLGRHGGASVSGEYAKLVSGLAHPDRSRESGVAQVDSSPRRPASYDFR